MQTFPTSNFVRRTISLSLDDPGLQWTDRSAARFGQEYRNIQLGGSFAGPLVQERQARPRGGQGHTGFRLGDGGK